ncbi:iron-containing alcohol dehydrogenase [Alicyclobacillus acidoterrestris]|uniref:Iron-containing alcohol dehydrogenase n=1 Tax=Alicyclobacillus acidoterrestris (strain ATCC 49025 / DSM 3922 / CIP 106132 / NCIMB 13137 / GD3B) TaxID=1356854 RepID=T0D1F9_ALIAG|nr:iron-containing alcohol dehydrogenase [Alicyclobacillus acidoterrestris]EPZ43566.1 NADH-dependent butanol dehydrogenase A [Alicyclobacillus acidoterrestris ATCC 49025]UNO50245.1 iron-containing alcohol dehydrogenase [Alicyclobacillus acidoterrestris]
MDAFRFQNPTALYYGKGQIEAHLAEEVLKYGKRVLVVYGGGSIKRNGLYDKVMNILHGAGVTTFELSGVEPNPRLTTVHKGVDICRTEHVDLILAVGGGSVLDCSKAIAMGVKYDGDVWEIYARKGQATGALPLGTILTLAATGSEMNAGGVITNWETKEKLGGGSPYTFPKFSFCDPENTYTVPRDQTVYGACDMLAHCFEHYFHKTEHTELQQHLIEGVIKTIVHNTKAALDSPNDYHARETLMYCSTMALNGMINMGLRGDWACHAMEHEVSAIYDIPHGGGLAIIFPHWMEYVKSENPSRFASLATEAFGVNPEGKSTDELADIAIAKVREYYKEIGAPQRLADYDIGDENLETMAAQAVRFGEIGQFKKLGKDDVYNILKAAL